MVPASAAPSRDDAWEDIAANVLYDGNLSTIGHSTFQTGMPMTSTLVARQSHYGGFFAVGVLDDFDFSSSSAETPNFGPFTPSHQSGSSLSQIDSSISGYEQTYLSPQFDRSYGSDLFGYSPSRSHYLQPPETVSSSSHTPSEAASDIGYDTTTNIFDVPRLTQRNGEPHLPNQHFHPISSSSLPPSISVSNEIQQAVATHQAQISDPRRGWLSSVSSNPGWDQEYRLRPFQSSNYTHTSTSSAWAMAEPSSPFDDQSERRENEEIGNSDPVFSFQDNVNDFPGVNQIQSSTRLLAVPPTSQGRRYSDPTMPHRPVSRGRLRVPRPRSSRPPVTHEDNRARGALRYFHTDFSASMIDIPPRRVHRGRRTGPLDEQGRQDARRKRNEKTTCIHCKYSKTRCDFDDPLHSCKKCVKSNSRKSVPFPCIRADFAESVIEGSLDLDAQHFIHHLCRDGVQRRRLAMPEMMKTQDILDGINEAQPLDTIEVSLGPKVLFTLDLEKCEAFMLNLQAESEADQPFRKFIDDEVRKDVEWKSCYQNPHPSLNSPETVIEDNEWQTRQLFTLVSSSTDSRRVLDPEDEADAKLLIVAAVFSRIVCRGLECDAIKYFQDEFNLHHAELQPSFLHQVGGLLLSLRRRISRWAILDSSLPDNHRGHEEKGAFTRRLEGLIRILYFQYCYLLHKNFSKERRSLVSGPFRGKSTSLPSGVQVWENYPSRESDDAFEQWLEDGKKVIISSLEEGEDVMMAFEFEG